VVSANLLGDFAVWSVVFQKLKDLKMGDNIKDNDATKTINNNDEKGVIADCGNSASSPSDDEPPKEVVSKQKFAAQSNGSTSNQATTSSIAMTPRKTRLSTKQQY